MHPTLVLALLASTVSAQTNSTPVTGILGDAAVISNNPSDSIYTATLPDNDKSSVRGSVVAQGVRGGPGVHFDVNLSGLPGSGGPFCTLTISCHCSPRKNQTILDCLREETLTLSTVYHIHAFPVPADGNCTGTLAHLDPYERGEVPTCDAASPATCQVGDLSDKHGKIPDNSSTFSARFVAHIVLHWHSFLRASLCVHILSFPLC